MAIFNSLGSNYNLGFALRTLLASSDAGIRSELIDFLEEKYKGQAMLIYKGRDALRLALRIIGRENCSVGICGFTCYAVYEGVVKEGYKPVYLDIDESLNLSFETLVAAKKKNPHMRILIVQNTLGFVCDMQKIAAFCREKDIILIEDLAHSIGAKYSEKTEVGLVGDFIVLSFSQDKMVDGISGGALIVKNYELLIIPQGDSLRGSVANYGFGIASYGQQMKDRLYPLLTFLIRQTYDFGLGRVLHAFLRRFKLLSMPMGKMDKDSIYGLPNWYCGLILEQFKELRGDLIHRRKIASIYADKINKKILIGTLDKQIGLSSNLRFPILVKDREELIGFLKRKKIFVSDIWYDAPIAPKKYLQMTDYKNQCPYSEKISQEMLNLPTHRNVSDRDAKNIAFYINQWLALQ